MSNDFDTEISEDVADREILRTQVHESRSLLVKGFLVIVGTISVGLGVMGIVLPFLPTTPFLLLAATCYAKSSERFYVLLLSNRYFGHYIRDWRENRGIALSVKLWIIFVLVVTMGISIVFFVPVLAVQIGMIIVALVIITYILRLPTKVEEETEE